jgi:hypothetical protein
MNKINLTLCRSVQNKNNINIQCNNKPKNNEILCGKHLNCKNLILYKEITINSLPIEIVNKLENSEDSEKELKKIYSKEELYEIISNNKPISIYSLRKSIKNCELSKIINTKQTKIILIDLLKKIIAKERYYISNVTFVILIQSFIRKWLIQRRKVCSNNEDVLTFTCKYEIPSKYFYIFYDNITKKKYCYDIRSLMQIITSDYQSCPYTFRLFSDYEKNNINKYVNRLINNGVDLSIEKKILTFEEETEMKMKDVFYQINMLDNYTDHNWFKDLSLFNLMELYLKMEDIWNYRSSMTMESKQKIVQNGIVFNIPPNIIKHQKSKLKLQNVLLDEFSRMINEGINRDEKKLGAILILTGLVEVSYDASIALPHLIQI